MKPKSVSFSLALGSLVVYRRFSSCVVVCACVCVCVGGGGGGGGEEDVGREVAEVRGGREGEGNGKVG